MVLYQLSNLLGDRFTDLLAKRCHGHVHDVHLLTTVVAVLALLFREDAVLGLGLEVGFDFGSDHGVELLSGDQHPELALDRFGDPFLEGSWVEGHNGVVSHLRILGCLMGKS